MTRPHPGDDSTALLDAFRAELRDPTQPLSLLVRFAVEGGAEEAVEAAFARARTQTLKEPGCRAYELHRDPRRPGAFVVYEQWRSLADLETHFQTDGFTTVRDQIGARLIAEPEFQVLLPTA